MTTSKAAFLGAIEVGSWTCEEENLGVWSRWLGLLLAKLIGSSCTEAKITILLHLNMIRYVEVSPIDHSSISATFSCRILLT